MRKLKLQMQISLDGFVAGPKGEMDWMVWDWDDALKKYVSELTKPVDCILLGRSLAQGFIDAWAERAVNPKTEEIGFIEKMNDTPKIVFSRTLEKVTWKNTTLAKEGLADEVNQLKKQSGGDIIAYGGASFTSSLIEHNLIDEYHLFVNPAALGGGMAIFKNHRLNLNLVHARSFDCGIVALRYQPNRS